MKYTSESDSITVFEISIGLHLRAIGSVITSRKAVPVKKIQKADKFQEWTITEKTGDGQYDFLVFKIGFLGFLSIFMIL